MHEILWSRFADIDNYTLYSLLRLRSEVFVVEQACAFVDLDGRDTIASTEHAWIPDEPASSDVLAGLRVFEDGPETVKISRVVTRPGLRGQGLGDQLMKAAIVRYRGSAIVLDAQTRLVAWYERLGFAADGDRFLEDDILHTPMRYHP